jgi:hypothetical protein
MRTPVVAQRRREPIDADEDPVEEPPCVRVPGAQRAPRRRAGANAVVAEWHGGTGFPAKSSGSAPVIAEGTATSTTTSTTMRRSDARRLTKDLSRAGVGATRAIAPYETRVEHDVSPRRSRDHGRRIE